MMIAYSAFSGLDMEHILLTVRELARYHAACNHYIMTRPQKSVWAFMEANPQFEVYPFFRCKGKDDINVILKKMEGYCIQTTGKVYQ